MEENTKISSIKYQTEKNFILLYMFYWALNLYLAFLIVRYFYNIINKRNCFKKNTETETECKRARERVGRMKNANGTLKNRLQMKLNTILHRENNYSNPLDHPKCVICNLVLMSNKFSHVLYVKDE